MSHVPGTRVQSQMLFRGRVDQHSPLHAVEIVAVYGPEALDARLNLMQSVLRVEDDPYSGH